MIDDPGTSVASRHQYLEWHRTDMTQLQDIIDRAIPPIPWHEGDNIPWHEPGFSRRMLEEHLTQEHNLASRTTDLIDMQVLWIHTAVLGERPSRVLDLACGPGLYLNRLAERGHHGTGIDFSPASIGYARQVARQANLDVTYVEGDLRATDFGSGFDLVMLLYGQLNVLQRQEATDLVRRVTKALNPWGTLIVEPQTYDQVKTSGLAKPVWTSHPTGLFSPNPHLLLTESFWHEESGNATQRFYVVDAESGDVVRHAMTNEAYTEAELMSLLADQGLTAVTNVGPLPGSTDNSMTTLVGHAAKST